MNKSNTAIVDDYYRKTNDLRRVINRNSDTITQADAELILQACNALGEFAKISEKNPAIATILEKHFPIGYPVIQKGV